MKINKEIHFDTWEHIHHVRNYLHKMQVELGNRGVYHDQTKIYSEEESEIFAKYTPILKTLEYGSDEYKASLEAIKPALKHHYASYRHHPEHFENGVDGMTLIDLVEMFCDWKASSLRTKNGDILKSIEVQKERFGLSDQLCNILINTAKYYEM